MTKPPLTTTNKPLPFGDLDPLEFERLCLWLVRAEGYLRPQHLGEAGSEQGRDVVAYKATDGGEECWYFQCKRYKIIGATALKEEVDKYDKLAAAKPGLRPAGIVFVTSAVVSANVRDAVAAYCHTRGYAYDFWARTELDMRVKQYPAIVAEFFAAGRVQLATALHQLPSPPGDFTGRAEELADLMTRLDQGGVNISGLRGQGGIGKTTLALKLAAQLAPHYPDAQFYLDLKGASQQPLAVAAALAHVIRAYHPKAKLPDDEAALSGLYQSVLHGQRALLLMDNAADKTQVAPLIPPAGCVLLVTSRQHFTLPGLYAKDLDTLPVADAHKLLLTIAPRTGAQADEIAQLCGYLPLALRLAASAIAERADLGVADYVRRLTDARQRLNLIEASLGLSYDLLSAELQQRWRTLAVFPVTFDAAAAAVVWATDRDAAQDALGELVKYSLLNWNDAIARYSLHDLARLFADSRMSDDERNTGQARHAAHYADVLGAADDLYLQGGAAIMRGLALFDAEWTNIQAGQAWAARHAGDDDINARLCVRYPDAGAYVLSLRQHPREQVNWLQQALVAARKANDRRGEGNALGNLGLAYAALGEPRRAIEFYEQALVIRREIGDRRGEGTDLWNMSVTLDVLGERVQAIAHAEAALKIREQIEDPNTAKVRKQLAAWRGQA